MKVLPKMLLLAVAITASLAQAKSREPRVDRSWKGRVDSGEVIVGPPGYIPGRGYCRKVNRPDYRGPWKGRAEPGESGFICDQRRYGR